MISKRIGILGAMPEEISGVVALLTNRIEVVKGKRTYFTGTINEIEVVVVFSRWGKVASATTVTHLIVEFGITQLLFTGVAGAISPELSIGDIVVASSLVQHDLDARPIMERFEIPLLGQKELFTTADLMNQAKIEITDLIATDFFLNVLNSKQFKHFFINKPKVVVGQIASGDQFFSSTIQREKLQQILPDVLCVEMEGAAVAQVCYEYEIPFVIIRTISDEANDNSEINFAEFVSQIASKFGVEIVKKLVN
jgi:adenosylhomocysteine nucleosidase